MRFHIHRDPDWQQVGVWRYFVCKAAGCDAVRIERGYANLLGPTAPGWSHLLVSRNGVHMDDSGWRKGTGLTYPGDDRPVRLPRVPAGPAPGAMPTEAPDHGDHWPLDMPQVGPSDPASVSPAPPVRVIHDLRFHSLSLVAHPPVNGCEVLSREHPQCRRCGVTHIEATPYTRANLVDPVAVAMETRP